MTACVNKKSKRVAAVVTASLVGALSIGAPAVALAANGIDMLVAGDLEDVAAGKITGYTNQDGKTVDSTEFKAGSEAQFLIPTELTTKTGQVIDVQKALSEHKLVSYYYKVTSKAQSNVNDKDADGNWLENVAPASITSAGTYYVGIGAETPKGANELCLLKFTIVNKSLKGAVVVDGKDAEDTVIDYSAKQKTFLDNINVALDGEILTNSEIGATFYKKGEMSPTSDVENVGDYILRVSGRDGSVYAGSVVDIPFSIVPVDLSKANIVLDNMNAIAGTALPTTVKAVDGNSDVAGELKVSFASDGAPSTAKGSYTLKVEPSEKDDEDIIGSATVTVVRYEKAASFYYNDAAISGSKNLNGNIDFAKLAVKGGNANLDYTVSYLENGKAVSADKVKTPGTYTAVVTVDDSTFTYGGSVEITFTVAAKEIDPSKIFVTYNGKVTGEKLDVVYSGEDFLSKLEISATDIDGKEVPAGELVLEAKVGGKVVDKIVDADTYTVTVKAKDGSMYEVKGGSDSFQIVVSPIVLTKAVLHGTVRDYKDGKLASEFLPYTGSVLTPSWTFEDKDGAVEVPESAWKVSYDKEVKEEGDYTATFSRTVGTKNYDFTGLTKKFTVAEAKSFGDVENSDWFVGAVFQAKENGYVNGVKGTKLFNPKANITRADAVCILYNMAGGKKVEDMTKAEKLAWTSKVTFTDVNVDEYYGVAMGWADSLDIANGSNGKFRPTDTITREEFAALLSNYAKATGDYEAVDADAVLGSATDYTSWAKDVVAWAKANGIMGNNGAAINGTGVITRAEVAAMAVNYQPEAL